MYENLFAVDSAYRVAVESGALDPDHARALDHALSNDTDLADFLAFPNFLADDPRFLVEYRAIFAPAPTTDRRNVSRDTMADVFVYLIITQPDCLEPLGDYEIFICHCADYAVWLTDYDDILPYPDPAVLSLYFTDDHNDPPRG